MFNFLKKKIKSQGCPYSETCLGTHYGGCNGMSKCIFMCKYTTITQHKMYNGINKIKGV
jgi:hypothetical protein